jgi:hypothetical protein
MNNVVRGKARALWPSNDKSWRLFIYRETNAIVVHHDVEKEEPNTFPLLCKVHLSFTTNILRAYYSKKNYLLAGIIS